MSDGQLNIIFGVLHERPDPDDYDIDRRIYASGTRSGEIQDGWKLENGKAQRVGARNDWISLTISQAAANTPAPVPAAIQTDSGAESAVQQRSSEIEQKLRVLDDLKAKGLISEEEYGSRRQAILDKI